MIKPSYPKTVPVLESHHIAKGILHDGDKSCLYGWSERTFTNAVKGTVEKFIMEAIKEKRKGAPQRIEAFNDKHSPKSVARVWNRAMYLLNYTEGNPESNPLGPIPDSP